jgi:hypothetical protein
MPEVNQHGISARKSAVSRKADASPQMAAFFLENNTQKFEV